MSEPGYDPLVVAERIRPLVVRGMLRRYYRLVRGGKWYGGIATADCTGCNLRCVFCWSGYPRDHPTTGRFYSPEEVFSALERCARRCKYRLLRVSGNEPTLGWEHLLRLMELIEEDGRYLFILETNGTIIGSDSKYARDLSKFTCVHVRVSLKGASEQEFHQLTGAKPSAFQLQLKALEHLLNYGVPCHPAVMLSFSSKEALRQLRSRLQAIDSVLIEEFEEEYVFLYPHVVQRLRRAGIKPHTAFYPDKIPKNLI